MKRSVAVSDDSQNHMAFQSKRMRSTKLSRQQENVTGLKEVLAEPVIQRKPLTTIPSNSIEQRRERESGRVNNTGKGAWAPSRSGASSVSSSKITTMSNNQQQAKQYDTNESMRLQKIRSSGSGRTSNGSSITQTRSVIPSQRIIREHVFCFSSSTRKMLPEKKKK